MILGSEMPGQILTITYN